MGARMTRPLRALRAAARFAYDLLVGDDWKVAVAVLVALAFGGALAVSTQPAMWVAPAVAVMIGTAFTAAVTVDAKRTRRSR
jgi:hypothetical protein